MKVYLDNCAIQRPLDDRSQVRIALEAEAIVGVFAFYELGRFDIISSEILLFEIENNPQISRKEFAMEVLKNSKSFVNLNDEIESRAKHFENSGIKPLDALHLATAEYAKVDFFCTCDDKFLKEL